MENHHCKSCGNQFKGNYCNRCGEKIILTQDRTIKHFFNEFISAITFADNKLWRTLKTIILTPGRFSNDFVNGKRNTYMKPVSIFFVANLIYFLFPIINTFTTPLEIQNKAFPYSPIVVDWVDTELAERGVTFDEYQILYNSKTAELSKIFLIVFAFLLSVLFLPTHFGSSKKYFADHLVMGLEVMTFTLLIAIQLGGLIGLMASLFGFKYLLSNFYSTLFAIIMLSYFFYGMERNFYEFKKTRAAINTLLCVGAIAITLFTYRALLFFITYWSI